MTKSLSKQRSELQIKKSKDIRDFVGALISAHQLRYKSRPPIESGKLRGQIKNFVLGWGGSIDKAIELIQVYYQMNDPWFVKRVHDFETFTNNLQKVCEAHASGMESSATSTVNWNKIGENFQ